MRRNKVFNSIVAILVLMPFIIVGICCLIAIFNKNYTPAELPTIIKSCLEDVLINFGCNRFAGNGSDILDKSIYLSNGWGLPLLPYFVGIFTTKSNIVANSGYLIFANWYLSYVLLVYLVAFIPKILLTFINFGYKCCDKFTERSF